MSQLHAAILWLTYPVALSICLLLVALFALLCRRVAIGMALVVVALTWSVAWSIPDLSDRLRHTLEDQHAVVAETALPRVDAIVVLGGGENYAWLGDAPYVDPDDLASSRVAAGARAWLAGRAPWIVLSGGRSGRSGHSEADRMAYAIERLGIPRNALVLEERSRDTSDNARFTAAIARERGIHRIALVTSSLHMPRASLLFRQAGLEVIAVPVPERSDRTQWRQRWLPSRRALWRSGRAIKEYAGLIGATMREPFDRLTAKANAQRTREAGAKASS
jgi:uncharacterized SAM-binding protein YcdF (DUF218 family)